MKKIIILAVASMLASCNFFPGGGPTAGAINDSVQSGEILLVPLTANVAKSVNVSNGYGFPSSLLNGGVSSYETIRSGDVIHITVWENVDNGLFATLGNRVTALAEIKVGQNGKIFVPYVGSIQASGKTSEQLRVEITNKLATATPDPQVEVRVAAGFKGGVRIAGSSGSASIPFNEGNLTLASMLSSAGITSENPRSTRLSLVRGDTRGTILLQMLYDNPRYDVALRDGDQIYLEADRRTFVRWSASGGASAVAFTEANVTLLDAITTTGGLDSTTANPSGVFVFRRMSANEANRLIGTSQYGSDTYVAFTIDLRDPKNFFVASDFNMQDNDIVYVTDAPFTQWTTIAGQVLGTIDTVTNVTDTVSGL